MSRDSTSQRWSSPLTVRSVDPRTKPASALRGLAATLAASFVAISAPLGCSGDDGPETSDATNEATSEGASSEGTTDGASSTGVEPTTAGPVKEDMSGVGAMCSLLQQDCQDGEKCVPFNENGGIFPDGVKCVPETPNADEIGAECLTMGGFGSGEDTCIAGSLCLDLDDDGFATCVEFCQGPSAEEAFCLDPDYTCVELFEPIVPVCFRKCNPLVQDCPSGEGCFMDAPMLGAEGFVCMPLVKNLSPGGGVFPEGCIAMSNCAPGNSCVFAENVPSCQGVYCCTPWCDLDLPDPCPEYEETMSCIPWYPQGEAPPNFENVGICGILP